MVNGLSVLAMFGICSIKDIRSRAIPVWWLVCFATVGIICQIFLWNQPVTELLVSISPGAGLLLLAYISRGNIGKGDALLLMGAGVFLGAACVARIFIYAAFLAAGYALYLYLVKKKNKNYEIPFIPFLLIAFAGDLMI